MQYLIKLGFEMKHEQDEIVFTDNKSNQIKLLRGFGISDSHYLNIKQYLINFGYSFTDDYDKQFLIKRLRKSSKTITITELLETIKELEKYPIEYYFAKQLIDMGINDINQLDDVLKDINLTNTIKHKIDVAFKDILKLNQVNISDVPDVKFIIMK